MATDPGLGWFADLIAQHAYKDGVPLPQRRRWDFVGSQWVITDIPATESVPAHLELSFTNEYDQLILVPIEGEPPGFPDEGGRIYAREDTVELFTPDAHWTFTTSTIDAQAGIPTIDIDTGTHPSPVTRLALDGGNKLYLMAADAVYFGTASSSYGYVEFDGSSGLVLRSDNNVRVRAAGTASIVGAGVEVEPDGLGSGGLSLTISGSAILELFAPSHDMRLTSGSGKDMILNSGNDIYLDADTGNRIFFYENGVEAASLLPDPDGVVTLQLGGSVTGFLIDMANSAPMQFNADTQVLADRSGSGALTLTRSAGIVIATVSAGLSLQGGASAIGIESSSQVAIQVGTTATIFKIAGIHVDRYTSITNGKRIEDINGERYYYRRISRMVQNADDAVNTLISFSTVTNCSYMFRCQVTASNNTDNELGLTSVREWSGDNVGGTFTMRGTMTTVSGDKRGPNSANVDIDGVEIAGAVTGLGVIDLGGDKDITWHGFLEVWETPIT